MAEALRKMAEDAEPGSDRFQMVGAFGRAARSADDIARLRGAFDGSQPYPGLEIDQDCGGRCCRRWRPWATPRTRRSPPSWPATTPAPAARRPSTRGRRVRPRPPRRRPGGSPSRRTASPTPSSRRCRRAGTGRRPVTPGRLRAAVLRRAAAGVEHPVGRDPRADHRQGVPAGVLPARPRRPELVEATESWLAANEDAPQALRRWCSRSSTPPGRPWSPSGATQNVVDRLNALAMYLVPTALPEPWQTLVGVPLRIVAIILGAALVRFIAHRLIDRYVRTTNSARRPPQGAPPVGGVLASATGYGNARHEQRVATAATIVKSTVSVIIIGTALLMVLELLGIPSVRCSPRRGSPAWPSASAPRASSRTPCRGSS